MVTAVALLLLLNDKCKPESLQRDGRPGWRFPQTAGCKARTCFVDTHDTVMKKAFLPPCGKIMGKMPPSFSCSPASLATHLATVTYGCVVILLLQLRTSRTSFAGHEETNLAWIAKSATDSLILSVFVVRSLRLHHINLNEKAIFWCKF